VTSTRVLILLDKPGTGLSDPVEGRWIARQIPGAKYVELPGDEHLVWAGDVDAVADEVEEFLTGTRAAQAADRVLATVLFTDIVASTKRAAAVGDRRWREIVDEHHTRAYGAS
jgi:class 3 adenylate cyclase